MSGVRIISYSHALWGSDSLVKPSVNFPFSPLLPLLAHGFCTFPPPFHIRNHICRTRKQIYSLFVAFSMVCCCQFIKIMLIFKHNFEYIFFRIYFFGLSNWTNKFEKKSYKKRIKNYKFKQNAWATRKKRARTLLDRVARGEVVPVGRVLPTPENSEGSACAAAFDTWSRQLQPEYQRKRERERGKHREKEGDRQFG